MPYGVHLCTSTFVRSYVAVRTLTEAKAELIEFASAMAPGQDGDAWADVYAYDPRDHLGGAHGAPVCRYTLRPHGPVRECLI